MAEPRKSAGFPLVLVGAGLGVIAFVAIYILACVFMLPGTVLYVYLGSLAGSLATLGRHGAGRTPAQWAFYGVGLLATVVVTVYATWIARAALAEQTRLGTDSTSVPS